MTLKYRFPYSDENGRCHDCSVLPGMWHYENCDVERCPFTFNQRLSCDCGKCDELSLIDKVPFGFEDKYNREESEKLFN